MKTTKQLITIEHEGKFSDEILLQAVDISNIPGDDITVSILPTQLYLLFKNHHLDDSGQDSCIGVFSDIESAKKSANRGIDYPLEWDEEDSASFGQGCFNIYPTNNCL